MHFKNLCKTYFLLQIFYKKLTKVLLIIFIITSCSYSTDRIVRDRGNLKLKRVEYSQLNNWIEDDHKVALMSFLNSCRIFNQMDKNVKVGNKIGNITAGDFHDVCNIASSIQSANSLQIRNFFENWFVPFEVSGKNGSNLGKFTGYFEPVLDGSFIKDDVYKYPVYAKPSDHERYSRKDIESGVLEGRGLELLYVNDRVELFFMHIQGTGIVRLPNGDSVKLAYAGKNNRPYKSIGQYMISNKVIKNNNYSYDSIKNWLRVNGEGAKYITNLNESYIFFKISDTDKVIGAQMAELTPERSLAIDKDLLPYGYPIWLEVKSKTNNNEKFYNKLLVTQDTGSAIKGAVRGDIFFGRGSENGRIAAKMNNSGNYYIFLPANAVTNL